MTMATRAAAFLRLPAVHFLIIGAALLAFDRTGSGGSHEGAAEPGGNPYVIEMSTAEVVAIAERYAVETGTAPDSNMVGALVRQAVVDEILYREAVAKRFHLDDVRVFRRVIEKMRILEEAGETEPDAEVFARGVELGLHRADPVVRQVLIQRMNMLVRFGDLDEEDVSEEGLRRYYDQHRERYRKQARVSFSHVFLSKEAYDNRLTVEAKRLLAELRSDAVAPEDAFGYGSAFPAGHRYTAGTVASLGKIFGTAFAESLFTLRGEGWQGPLRSPHGMHIVQIHSLRPAEDADFESVRTQLVQGVLAEMRGERFRRMIGDLRERYEVRIEGVPGPGAAG